MNVVIVKFMVAAILALSVPPAFAEESLLVEAARRATAHWDAQFGRCAQKEDGAGAWYAVSTASPGEGNIQMALERSIEFKTEPLTQEEKLNGVQFKATTSLSSGAFRWWIAKSRTWQEWQVGLIAPPMILIRKHGAWTIQASTGYSNGGRKALTICSQIPGA